jgi:glycosyltransferase involved in cell wall biosynthesis
VNAIYRLFPNSSPLNPRWSDWIIEYARQHRFNALFQRETVLSLWVRGAGKKLNIPVFLDMRENLAAMYSVGRAKNPFLGMMRHKRFIHCYESYMVPKFDHVFTVSDELGQWARRTYHLNPQKMSNLGNYPSKTFLKQAENALIADRKRSEDDPFRLVHAGYVRENRGLQDVAKALKILIQRDKINVVLRVIGEGDFVNPLKGIAKHLGIAQKVEFIPMLPPDKVAGAMAECDIGLCCYLLSEQTQQTIPGKLFEYMAVGLPVLSSGRKPVVRIVERERCGLAYHSRDPESIASAILSLYKDQTATREMGMRGREAILKTYNYSANLNVVGQVLEENNVR